MASFGLKSSAMPPAPLRLVPYLKPGQHAQHSYHPGAFETQKGRLLVPHLEDPPAPTPEMINKARRGQLTGFFQDGHVFCASDLIGMVSAQTAKISLDDTYEFQTRQLSALASIIEADKSLRNLFYIALRVGELPSYHFWTECNDPNLVTSREPIDWGATLEHSRPADWKNMQQRDDDSGDVSERENVFNDSPSKNGVKISTKTQMAGSSIIREQRGAAQEKKATLTFLDANEQKSESNNASVGPTPTSNILEVSPTHVPSIDRRLPRAITATRMENDFNQKASTGTEVQQASSFNSQHPAPLQSPMSGEGQLPDETKPRQSSMLAVSAKPGKDEPRDSSQLLRCERGGMYLKDFSTQAFKDMAFYLVQQEEDEKEVGSGQRFVDILKGGETQSETHLIGSGIPFARMYAREIQPFLGFRGCHFRIRSDAYDKASPWDTGRDGTIKVTRVGVGYCYVNAAVGWNSRNDSEQRRSNGDRFKSALNFLFGRDQQRPARLTLEFPPDDNPIDFDYGPNLVLSPQLEEILEDKARCPTILNGPFESIPSQYPAEIFVHETGTKFMHPLVLATEAMKVRKVEEASREEACKPEQQNPQAADDASDVAQQQQERKRWSIGAPITVFDFNRGPSAPSLRSQIRVQLEIGDLRRRLKTAEDRLLHQSQVDRVQHIVLERNRLRSEVEGLLGQIGYLTREHSEMEGKAQDAEREIEDLVQERSVLRARQRNLENESQRLREGRNAIQNRVNGLENEVVRAAETRSLLQLTVDGLGRQVQEITEERDKLRCMLNDKQQDTNEQDQETSNLQDQKEEHTNQESAGRSTDQSGISTTDEQLQDAVASASNQPPPGIADPKKLLYCTLCLKSVDKLDRNVGTQKTRVEAS